MRNYFPHLVGNRKLAARLGADIAAGHFSHAAILEGAAGCGKHTFAREIAMAVACENRCNENLSLPCGICRNCKKIAAGNSPDLLWFKRPEGKVTTGVETVRSLREGIAVLPNDLDVKIYVLEDAHTLTVQAQNAFLLTLEEPPPFVLFLLLTEDAGSLLETVRSRAPIYRLSKVSDEEITAFLKEQAPGEISAAAKAFFNARPAEFEEMLRLADGSIGKAEELLNEKKREPLMERRANAKACFHLLAQRKNSNFLLLLQSACTNREEANGQLAALSLALRDLILLTQQEHAPLLFFTNREEAADLSASFSATRLFSFSALLDEAADALLANANLKLTISRLCDRMMGN